MRIGFDIDGVLAAFVPAYQRLVIEVAGVDKFHEGDNVDPPCWNWPEFRGYDKAVVSEVWSRIKASGDFWFKLNPLDGVSTLKMMLPALALHDVYFITSRLGSYPKAQTEDWLCKWLEVDEAPTTLIVGHRVKGIVAKALQLDVYIDDNLDNVIDCLCENPSTRTYLLDRRYNQGDAFIDVPQIAQAAPGARGIVNAGVKRFEATRVSTLGQMFDIERDRL